MIPNVIIILFVSIVILYFPVERLKKYITKRKQDKQRQKVKRYYMQMYYKAPSLREAEYWLDKYNKGV